jgi:hypothetical protein
MAGEGAVQADVKRGYPAHQAADWATIWEATLFQLLASIPANMRGNIAGALVTLRCIATHVPRQLVHAIALCRACI